jgi:hypothetical protein
VIISVCADKGSPGVSMTATALALMWPGERVLLEADPSGGDAALRMRGPDGGLLPRNPTIRALSVDARGGALASSFAAYAHETSLGVPVIPATDMSSQDLALIARQWPAVAASAANWAGTVVADLGRLQEDHAAGALAASSAAVLLIGRGTAEGMFHLRERASALAARLGQGLAGRSPLTVAVVCPPRSHVSQVRDMRALLAADAATTPVPVIGWLAEDTRGAQALRDGQLTKRLLTSPLVRSAESIIEALAPWTRAAAPPPQPWDRTVARRAGANTGLAR